MPRSRSTRVFAILASSIATIIPFVACQQYSSCDATSYYSAITDLTNRDQLHSHIQNTHRTSLPYSSSSRDDVWDALAALDSDDSGENLLLVYGDKYVPVAPRDGGTCEYKRYETSKVKSGNLSLSLIDIKPTISITGRQNIVVLLHDIDQLISMIDP